MFVAGPDVKTVTSEVFAAAERGYIDEVITPRTTRKRVARAMLRGKRVEMPARKHDNLPV